jgi:nitrogen fixation/metabolism regulation signal transduction histidine kinase
VTFRARLVLALLALALLPTAVFTLFTLDQLDRSTARWFRPGVDRALESAFELTRTSTTRLESTLLAQSDDWAARAPSAAEARARLRVQGLDFAQWYLSVDGDWRLESQQTAEGVLPPRPMDLAGELSAALAGDRVVRSRTGALAAVARADRDRAVLVGLWVSPDSFERADSIAIGAAHYRRLGVLVDMQRRYVWLLLAALVVVVSLLAAWLAATLARGMTRPLADVASALERVAAGDLESPLEPAGAREVRSLGVSFNAMRERLAAAREQLRMAEREAAWREVARRLAHEIKNPLTPMRLSLHRLQRRASTVPAAERAAVEDSLAALLTEVEHLSRLAEQFSRYARLPEPHLEPIDLAAVAREVGALHEPDGLTLTMETSTPLPVTGDRLLLSRALHNLLLNACEASPAGSTVELRSLRESGQAVVEVLDRGPGLPAELQARVFEPYVSSKQRGSGLGLSLVRDIATQHGGTVTLDDREGGGARARLTLPLRHADGGDART